MSTIEQYQPAEFSDFMWMENIDDFDREFEMKLQEEDTMSVEWHCMIEEEEAFFELCEQGRDEELTSSNDSLQDLNPLADPFVPTSLEHIAV